jgi:hypothetical protein
MFGLNVLDDKKKSWCAPGDCTGKVFVKIRELNSDPQDTSDLTYDDTEDFLRFLDKYVSRAVGNHTFARWKKSHQTKTLLDKISASDIAYTILVYENSREVWEEELFIKARAKTDEERKNAQRRHNPRYHKGRGKRLKRYGDGWTEEGRKYYQELLTTFQDLKSSVFWDESLQGYWGQYQIKHYGKTRDDYNNTESDIDEDEDEPEEDWKVEAEEYDSDINAGDMSDEDDERRIRARRI